MNKIKIPSRFPVNAPETVGTLGIWITELRIG
jgi:hypothetical protein